MDRFERGRAFWCLVALGAIAIAVFGGMDHPFVAGVAVGINGALFCLNAWLLHFCRRERLSRRI